ncbi:MAG: cytidylate kinase-like family protein [Clostridia bacterium]|nr:cytidylate kinase-like family protein [Clostridia bacterium]
MNKIITIGREFGSGGRELGKELAELLGFAYYDKEIVQEIAKRTQLAEEYLHAIVENHTGIPFPITVGRTLYHHNHGGEYLLHHYAHVYSEQANVLREMAERSDCVIVGSCSDYILKDYHPVRLFVYAEEEAKVARCRANADEHEQLSDKQLRRMIKKVDKNRARHYHYHTGQIWGNRTNYDFCINTSAAPLKEIAEALAPLLKNIKAER